MRICPNDKFIEIFAQRFHYFADPLYKFFALNLIFQDTSYSLALKYSSLLVKFLSFAFYNINFWFKISKICPKISHFSQISHSRGNTAPYPNSVVLKLVGSIEPNRCHASIHRTLNYNQERIQKILEGGCSFELG